MTSSTPLSPALVLLYDGDCGFCEACVVWASERTRVPFVSRPLDSVAGRESLRTSGIPFDIESVVVLVSGSALTKSDAVLAVFSQCRFPWHLAHLGKFVPRAWRDGLYDLVARHRHRLSSKGCRIG